MKKLKLNKIDVSEVLTRQQLKNIVGGSGSGTGSTSGNCKFTCYITLNGNPFVYEQVDNDTSCNDNNDCEPRGCDDYAGSDGWLSTASCVF